MKRRQFLKTTALGYATSLLATPSNSDAVVRRESHGHRSFALEEITIGELQTQLANGQITSVSLVEKYLHRIRDIDRRGPKLNSVIEVNPDALPIARQLDQERKAKGPRGPLHGIPILIKDNIETHDALATTAGSLALVGSKPQRDAFLVGRLREAGAVLLGKTNLSEWANFRSSHSTSGWSGRGGLTRNPYLLDRNPSGSSSGSGAAVAANLCVAAVGTETDGSILSPSSVNGIVGLKPTLGLISRSGIVPIAHSQDTAGPMARSVTDAAILLGVLAGQDPRDPATASSEGKASRDYTQHLDPAGLKGARIGVVRDLFDVHPNAVALVEEALEEMRRAGAIIVDPAGFPSHGKVEDGEFEVLLYEFKADLNQYLSQLGPEAPVHSLADVITFNQDHRDVEMPCFGQELMLKAEAKGPLSEPAYQKARALCLRVFREEGIDAVIREHQLDALVAPTTGPAHLTDLLLGDRDIGGSTQPAAVAGYPSITVPAGFVSELPVGISFFGVAYSEPTLIRLAYAFEQATHLRRPPRFLPSLPSPGKSAS